MNPRAEVTLKYIESYVKETLNTEITQRFQDQKAVELEITEKIADRAIKWAKVFGFFAGIPLAIFAIILSFLGVKTYSDLQKASENVTAATSQLGEAQKTLKSAQESSQKLIDATAQVGGDIQKRLNALLENIASIEKEVATASVRLEEIPELKKRQEQLETEIREIEKRVSFESSAELTPEIQGKLETSLEKYLNYLNAVGFPRNPTKVKIKVEKATTALAYYHSGEQTIVIDSRIVNDEHVAFREYTHHVLIHGTQARFSLDQLQAIESALADYFPCSFTNNPNLGEVTAKVLNVGRPYIRTLENERHFGEFANIEKIQFPYEGAEIWGGAFWKIRRLLRRKVADTLLFETWSDASSLKDEDVSADQFLTALMSRSQHSLQATQVEGIQQIMKKRGFPLP